MSFLLGLPKHSSRAAYSIFDYRSDFQSNKAGTSRDCTDPLAIPSSSSSWLLNLSGISLYSFSKRPTTLELAVKEKETNFEHE